MANTASAAKRARQTARRNQRNRRVEAKALLPKIGKGKIRVIRDSKHTGTVSRQTVVDALMERNAKTGQVVLRRETREAHPKR